jgi:hypothetical protein
MAAVTPTVTRGLPQNNLGMLLVTTPATSDPGDTCAIDLSTYGLSTFVAIKGFVHTTLGSVVVTSAPTTSVSGTTLTITMPSGDGNTDKARAYIVWAQPVSDGNI